MISMKTQVKSEYDKESVMNITVSRVLILLYFIWDRVQVKFRELIKHKQVMKGTIFWAVTWCTLTYCCRF